MLEHWLKILDSFKERQTSRLLRIARKQILDKVQGPYFSPEIRHYFANPNKIGDPFTNFSSEPKQVVQIKEIINGIYYAELAFRDLETVNLRGANWLRDIGILWSRTIKNGYHASYLLTHLGIDLTNIFSSEIKLALSCLHTITRFTDNHTSDAINFAEKIKAYPLSYNAGKLCGIAVDQMKAGSGTTDVDFLFQFGATLPGYLQQFTNYILTFSSELASVKPTFDQKKLDELLNNAAKLVSSGGSLLFNEDDIFLPVKLLYNLDLLRHIIYNAQSILEQAKNFDENQQEVIRAKLAELKYKWLIPLFHSVDRIEDEALLTPGTLSQPLMNQLKTLYKLLIDYTSKIVDFSVKGQELLTIEDNQFLALRLQPIAQQTSRTKCQIIELELAEEAFTHFFDCLSALNANDSLLGLPINTKKALESDYKYLHQYVRQIDGNLHNEIIHAFSQSDSWLSLSSWSFRKLKLSSIGAIKDKLDVLLKKEKATLQLHVKLNEEIIKSIKQHSQFAANDSAIESIEKTINEHLALQKKFPNRNGLTFASSPENDILVVNTSDLSAEQAFALYEYYTEKIPYADLIANQAKKAYREFYNLIYLHHPNPLIEIDDGIKANLRQLYCSFKSYLRLDDTIIAELSSNATGVSPSVPRISTSYFIANHNVFLGSFAKLPRHWQERAEFFQTLAKQKSKPLLEVQILTPENTNLERKDHLIKNKEYSTAIREFKESLLKLLPLFNDAVGKELKPTLPSLMSYIVGTPIPFPELENLNQRIAQGEQVIGIKQLLNCVDHLEKACHELEKLNDNSYQWNYVRHLVLAYNHVAEIMDLSKALYEDPFFRVLGTDLVIKAKKIAHTLISQSEPYRTDADSVIIPGNDKKTEYGSIWYSLNALLVAPAHISALLKEEDLSADELSRIEIHAKETVHKIESIIESSDSYLKLFIKSPLMYSLFKELKQKIKQFSALSHQTVMTHLEEINTDLFTRILLETDLWENRLGLKPGYLSGPVKAMLDEFYRGLVEPLGCISQQHVALLTNDKPLTTRLVATDEFKQDALAKKTRFVPSLVKLEKLMDCIKIYENFTNPSYGSPQYPEIVQAAGQNLITAYKEALPILQDKEDLLVSLTGELEASPTIDALLAPETPDVNTPAPSPQLPEHDNDSIIKKHHLENYKKLQHLIDMLTLYDESYTAKQSNQTLEDIKSQLIHAFEQAIPIFRRYPKLLISISAEINRNPQAANEIKLSPQIDEILASKTRILFDKLISPTPGRHANEHFSPENILFGNELFEKNPHENPSINSIIKIMENQHIMAQCQLFYENYEEEYYDLIHAKLVNDPNEKRKKHIKARCAIVYSHFQSIIKTLELQEKTAAEKERYLIDLKDQQPLVKDNAIADYLSTTFTKYLNLALSRRTNFYLLEKEYQDKLKHFLLEGKDIILEAAHNASDIEGVIKKLLNECVEQFDNEFFKNFAHLDEIIEKISQFDDYAKTAAIKIDKGTSWFETKTTLQRKQHVVQRLNSIASQSQLPPEERIAQLKQLLSSPLLFEGKTYTFSEIMLAHSQPTRFTFAWLVQLVSSFLELFDLYAPNYRKVYDQLNNSIIKPPEQLSLNPYRMFPFQPTTVPRYTLPAPVLSDTPKETRENRVASLS